jgi:hypothetical protein
MDRDGYKQDDRALRLVASPESVLASPAPRPPSLTAAPFRPGELPITSWIPLESSIRALVSRRANEEALPIELWVRIAVEASRLTDEISTLTNQSRQGVIDRLDIAASALDDTQTLSGSELRRYAAELRRSHATVDADDVLALRLPEEISGAWGKAASAARVDMPHWIAHAIRAAPAECVAWEAAAASTCRSLGEWAYASWLQASANSMA